MFFRAIALVAAPLAILTGCSSTMKQEDLEARTATTVRWPGGERRFSAGERIHTENSYKWTPVSFAALLRDAGYAEVQHWTDPQGWFGVFLATG